MLLARLVSRLTETEKLIETEITEGIISHLRSIQADIQPFFDDFNLDSELRAKIDEIFEKRIAHQEQESYGIWEDDSES